MAFLAPLAAGIGGALGGAGTAAATGATAAGSAAGAGAGAAAGTAATGATAAGAAGAAGAGAGAAGAGAGAAGAGLGAAGSGASLLGAGETIGGLGSPGLSQGFESAMGANQPLSQRLGQAGMSTPQNSPIRANLIQSLGDAVESRTGLGSFTEAFRAAQGGDYGRALGKSLEGLGTLRRAQARRPQPATTSLSPLQQDAAVGQGAADNFLSEFDKAIERARKRRMGSQQ